ncbi:CCR4-NOT core DEDD RNase subunit [Vermiconidia calcicola]|uniref:CCR4-NOT core DEDD RNase subunit n=1 Tax=Vermiconidia calcicola TaxID=1690605 RepID=A0ACC3NKI7_9PEZI|nr:CCR4-NOT core DEDD RNase subunit [Vermiconidia calcicola]
MPPAVSRMHPSHMSNPFQHLNPQHSIPQQSSHYQSQSQHLPNTFNPQHAFASGALNGGISPFNPASAYGGSAFSNMPGTGGSTFNGGVLGGQGQGLASVAAQQGFARGAAMQEHSHAAAEAGLAGVKAGAMGRIREVWRHNLEQEMAVLRQLIIKYPYVSMDAEFPGIVARPVGAFAQSKAEYHYQTLRCNVDILKPIQVGITLWTAEGDLPPQQPTPDLLSRMNNGKSHPYPHNNLMYLPCTWVFNFQFNLEDDMYAEASIELLKSSGVDFARHLEMGIVPESFGALLTTSGLVFSEDVNWLSFHSGYDFGYLIKLLSDDALPIDQNEFFEQVKTFFPKLWDIKFMLRDAQKRRNSGRLGQEGTRIIDALGTKSGLQDLAEELGCQRVGVAHTGGSDAWLTGNVFFGLKNKIFNSQLEDDLADQIYGLHGVSAPAPQHVRDEFFAAQGTPGGQQASQSQQNGLGGAFGGGQQGFTPNNNPSTPTGSHAGLSTQTPGPQQGQFGHGGVSGFGGFQFGK